MLGRTLLSRAALPALQLPALAPRAVAAPVFAQVSTREYHIKKKKNKKAGENPNALPLAKAIPIIKAFAVGKPNHSLELHVKCLKDKTISHIKGSLQLPKGLRKETVILVFAEGKAAQEAIAAGAQIVGGAELIPQIQEGKLQFDKCISTPALFPQVTKIARILGPKGLMPTVKKGTVTDEVGNAIRGSKDVFDFMADSRGVIHTAIGRVGWSDDEVESNIRAFMKEVRQVGKTVKKGFIQRVHVCSSVGPGVLLSDV
ncbi:ribosomal protein L1 [Basidiobolus meristosporus CBS 931.73]|uniref:Ribosomal protein L1 n=1 Tax=Basidiobolus meristosporus CBS 931.73 TaxID=1314790 RepID=A0A1Y1XZB1_9FUNG|nr:ribosomal protein L1 [Basidiobolus meristosporus CBS 931.73]|eukprot:ORX91103.1 ribosomal protein L1 [Basidiobolus meristosporus CBS 931.73]